MIERTPPHNVEAELDVLAACLMAPEAMATATAAGLKPGDFYQADHGALYGVMLDLFNRREDVGLSGIRERGTDVTWSLALDLTARLATYSGIEYNAAVVLEHAARRAAIVAYSQALVDLFDPQADDPVSSGLGRVMAVESRGAKANTRDFFDVVDERMGLIHEKATGPRDYAPTGFTTGLPDLDSMANIEPGDLIVLGARPSTGKTALALQILTHVAAGRPVLFFSLEMSAEAIAGRFFTHEMGVSAYRQMTGYLNREEISQLGDVSRKAMDLRLRIDDTPGLTVAQMRAIARREHVRTGGLGLIAVDHMILVKADDPRATGHARLSQISLDLKNMGRSLGVPVLALTQLNRAVEGADREPGPSDMRESGSIEEVADHVWLMHRPNREGVTNDASLIYAKQRNGPVGRIALVFDTRHTRFACRINERMESA